MYDAVPRIDPSRVPPTVIVGDCVKSAVPTSPVATLRQTKVEHFDDAVGRDLDVRRLQIAVDDALLVRGFERIRYLARQCQSFIQAHGSARDSVGQRLAVDQFEHQRAARRRRLPVRRSRRCGDD